MSSALTLTVYCIVILAASLVGGWIPMLVRLTHRRMQVALSFVSGVMLGVALLELLPHAISEAIRSPNGDGLGIDALMRWLVGGFLAMFLLERFFSFHHHDQDEIDGDDGHGHDHGHGHGHDGHGHGGIATGAGRTMSWTGAAIGLTVHALIAGIALAAAVLSGLHHHGHDHGHDHAGAVDPAIGLAGFGTFLVITLHKPFDSLTIGTLMAARGSGTRMRHLINAAFSLAVPLGAILFVVGVGEEASPAVLAAALAFAAGTFLCIALTDVLPELQFHHHDRVLLSLALILGLVVAGVVAWLEAGAH